MGAPEITTGLKTDYPCCFARDRDSILYVCNGLNRPLIWDGVSEAMYQAGIIPPEIPAVQDDTTDGDAEASSVYLAAVNYEDGLGRLSELSPAETINTSGAADHRFDWTGIQRSTEPRVKYVNLWRTTAGQSTTFYKVAQLGNDGVITQIEDNGSGDCRITCSDDHSLLAGAVVIVSGTTEPSYITSHNVTTVISGITFDTDIPYVADDTGVWVISGYLNEDDLGDDDLSLNEALPVLNEDDELFARRQGVPPSELAVCSWFQDRMYYAVTRKYISGTVATTALTRLVTGAGTNWIAEFGGNDIVPARGREWYIQIENEPRPLKVDSWTSDTVLNPVELPTLTQSGVNYVLYPDPRIFRNTIFYSEIDEGESIPYDPELGYVNSLQIQENSGDDDELTGLMTFGYGLFVLKERHIYRLQNDFAPSVFLVASRGCVNNRCWTYHESLAYLMDGSGAYSFDGNNVDPISLPIQNYWRDGLIDFTNSRWFFASIDSTQEVVRFHVQFTGDDGTYPTRALCYHLRYQGWWVETYPWVLGGACKADIGYAERMLVGSTNESIYVSNEGFTDAGTTIAYAWRGGKHSLVRDNDSRQTSQAWQVAFQPTIVSATMNANIYLDNKTTPLPPSIDQKLGENIKLTKDDSDLAINLQEAIAGNDQPGFARLELGGRTGMQATTSSWISVQFSGDAPDSEQVVIYGVALEGVKGGA